MHFELPGEVDEQSHEVLIVFYLNSSMKPMVDRRYPIAESYAPIRDRRYFVSKRCLAHQSKGERRDIQVSAPHMHIYTTVAV